MGSHPWIRLDINRSQLLFFEMSAGKSLDEATSWAALSEEEKDEKRNQGLKPDHIFIKMGCHEDAPFVVIKSYILDRFVPYYLVLSGMPVY